MKRQLLYLTFFILCLAPKQVHAQDFNHHLFWFRLVLTDTITERLRWEVYLQNRTQSGTQSKTNLLEANHMRNIWVWFGYRLNDQFRLLVSPLGLFQSSLLISRPEEQERDPVKEYRFSARLDQENKYARFSYSSRIAVESRWRDLYFNGQYLQNFRFRYVTRVDAPLGKKTNGNARFILSAYNETMIQAGPAVKDFPNVFDQNRSYIGLSTPLYPNIRFSLGYLFIVQQRLNGKDFDQAHTLWAVLTFDNVISRFKKSNG